MRKSSVLAIFLGILSRDSADNTGEIKGRVTDQAGTPISEATIVIASGTSPFPDIAALTDEQGKYQLSGIPTGTFDVAVYADGYAAQNRTITVKEGETSIPNFALLRSEL